MEHFLPYYNKRWMKRYEQLKARSISHELATNMIEGEQDREQHKREVTKLQRENRALLMTIKLLSNR